MCLSTIFLVFQIFFNCGVYANAAKTETPKITVIGAGLAGLTTAYRLQTMGYSVELYEARDRAGGRICTAYFGDSYEELGGKNIDDASNPKDMLDLICEFGLHVSSSGTSDPRKRMNLLNGEVSPFLMAFREGPEPSESNYAKLKEKMNDFKSLADLMDFFFGKSHLSHQCMEWIMSGYEGTDPNALTPHYLDIYFWKFYKRYYEISHDLERKDQIHVLRSVKGGNSLLIKALTGRLDGHIHYNMPLRRIVRCKSNKRIILDFGTKNPVETDYLVLALPCSTLRDVKIEPSLIPNDQMLAIQSLQYGTNAKILLPIKGIDELTARSLITKNMSTWMNEDFSIMTFYYSDQKGIFDCQSSEVLQNMLSTEISTVCLLHPEIEFPLGLNPCSRKEVLDTVYDQPVGISWMNEEFSKGSYSNCGIDNFIAFHDNCEEYQEKVLSVFRSIDGSIFFAGEHTDIDDFATMGGAVRSGEKAARMVDRELENRSFK
ncbi:MAG: FAD-dependent oxidoreductase [Parachlamydiaceae bacterium]|nr:FAD-dependent oxidoreductase [Parachlamydiaceae bacterium]